MATLWDDVGGAWAVIAPMMEVRGRDVTQANWDMGVISWIGTLHPEIKTIENVVKFGADDRPQFDWSPRGAISAMRTVRGVVYQRATHKRTGILKASV